MLQMSSQKASPNAAHLKPSADQTDEPDTFMLFRTKSSSVDIELNLPQIVIPLNSQSDSAIVIDLGHLEATNTLSKVVGIVNKIGQPALIDTLHINWTAINISRYVINQLEVNSVVTSRSSHPSVVHDTCR